jgi:hypothetical protein
MSDEPKKKRRRATRWVLTIIALYVLSFGPMFYVAEKSLIVGFFYAPLLAVAHTVPGVRQALAWYCGLWPWNWWE